MTTVVILFFMLAMSYPWSGLFKTSIPNIIMKVITMIWWIQIFNFRSFYRNKHKTLLYFYSKSYSFSVVLEPFIQFTSYVLSEWFRFIISFTLCPNIQCTFYFDLHGIVIFRFYIIIVLLFSFTIIFLLLAFCFLFIGASVRLCFWFTSKSFINYWPLSDEQICYFVNQLFWLCCFPIHLTRYI